MTPALAGAPGPAATGARPGAAAGSAALRLGWRACALCAGWRARALRRSRGCPSQVAPRKRQAAEAHRGLLQQGHQRAQARLAQWAPPEVQLRQRQRPGAAAERREVEVLEAADGAAVRPGRGIGNSRCLQAGEQRGREGGQHGGGHARAAQPQRLQLRRKANHVDERPRCCRFSSGAKVIVAQVDAPELCQGRLEVNLHCRAVPARLDGKTGAPAGGRRRPSRREEGGVTRRRVAHQRNGQQRESRRVVREGPRAAASPPRSPAPCPTEPRPAAARSAAAAAADHAAAAAAASARERRAAARARRASTFAQPKHAAGPARGCKRRQLAAAAGARLRPVPSGCG